MSNKKVSYYKYVVPVMSCDEALKIILTTSEDKTSVELETFLNAHHHVVLCEKCMKILDQSL